MNNLKVTRRTEVGKNKVDKMRASGVIPGVVYGRGSESIQISMLARDIEKFLTMHEVGVKVQLKIDEENQLAVLKDVQRNPVTHFVEHADFQMLKAGELIKIKIPVHVINRDSVEDSRTVVQDSVHEIEIVSLPKDLIDAVTIDVAGKEAGDHITVGDIIELMPKGIVLNEDHDKILVSIVGRAETNDEEAVEEESLLEVL